MLDKYKRKIDYIRISVTDRCNLRCVYCMPEEGVPLVEHEKIMSFDEIILICKQLVKSGFKKVKLTGGEPLVRRSFSELVKQIKNIDGIEKVTITTNGVLLEENLKSLIDAGIDGINISLDTLDPEKFKKITRRDEFDRVIRGIKSVLEYPQIVLKLNCVPIDMSAQDILDYVNLAKDNLLHVRFIEVMPIGYGKQFEFSGEDDIKKVIESEYGELTEYNKTLGNGPSRYYSLDNFKGKVGFISAISHKFCHECNRVRLTSQGFLKTCLQYEKGVDLLEIIRNGGSEEELKNAIYKAIYNKPMEHSFLNEDISDEERGIMSQIGG